MRRWRMRLGTLLLVAAFCSSVVALAWLAWLSPPSRLFDPKRGEPRLAIPIERLAPKVPIQAIRSDIDKLQEGLYLLEGSVDTTVLESQLAELESQIEELDGRVSGVEASMEDAASQTDDLGSEVEDRVSELESRLGDAESELGTLEALCDALSVADGALYDLYFEAC